MLVSVVQQSDSDISEWFIMVYYRILNIVPCALQWDLVVYLFFFKSLKKGHEIYEVVGNLNLAWIFNDVK